MIRSLSKGVLQLREPSTKKILWVTLGISILACIALFAFIDLALTHTSFFQVSWIEILLDFLGRLAAVMITWLLFPVIISGVISLFLEGIARAVEAQHYPNLPQITNPSIVSTIISTGKFLSLLIVLNIGLLFFFFTGPIYIVLYYIINGYLISREFFDLISLRRVNAVKSGNLRKIHKSRLIFIGTIFVFLMQVPIVNLLVPIVATATMLHLFENWRSHDRDESVKI